MKNNIILRQYQEDAIQKGLEAVEKFENNSLIVMPTAAGKSLVIAGIAERLGTDILILQPSSEVLQQNMQKLSLYVEEDKIGVYSASFQRKDIKTYTFATIQSIYKKPELFSHIKTVIIDESDLVNSKNSKGMFTSFLKELGNPITIGLTATPFRNVVGYTSVGGVLTAGTSLKLINRMNPRMWNRIVYNINNHELLEQGYLTQLKYFPRTLVNHKDIPLNKSRSDFDLDAYTNLIYPEEEKILASINEARKHRKAVLVFCSAVEQAQRFAKAMNKADVVTGTTPLKKRKRILEEFQKGNIQVLFNVSCLTVGYDYPALDTIYLLRPTRSLRLYMQMCLDMETEILTKRGFLKYKDVNESDLVCSKNLSTNKLEWKSITAITHRKLYPFEYFVKAKNSQLNFRVTNTHNMLVKSRKAVSCTLKIADDLFLYKDLMHLPISGVEDRAGVSLTEWEIKFLGLWLADGSRNKSSLIINQSVINKTNIEEIETILNKCNFHYKKYITKRKGKYESYPDYASFVIPSGVGLGDRAGTRRGWNSLTSYLDKNLNDEYEEFSTEQMGYLIHGIHLGDGDKYVPRDYIRASRRISMGINKLYADRIQSLLVRSGYKCNMVQTIPPYVEGALIQGRGTQYHLYYCKKNYVSLAGSQVKDNIIKSKAVKRTRLEKDYSKKEYVWCVSNDNGTIVTRREGKILIMGNCGRGVRIAEGKDSCYILDYSGNFESLGRLENVKLVKEKLWELYANGVSMHNKELFSWSK